MRSLAILILSMISLLQPAFATVSDPECEALLAQYASIVKRMATTHVDSGGSLALKILSTTVKRKLLAKGIGEDQLLNLGQQNVVAQQIENNSSEQAHTRQPLTRLETAGERNRHYNSVDGRYIGYATDTGDVAIFNNGEYDSPVFETKLYDAYFSSSDDGKYLMITYASQYAGRRRAKVFEVGTWNIVYTIDDGDNAINTIALTLDQRHIFVAKDGGQGRLIDISDFSVIELNPDVRFSYLGTAIVSQDNRYLFATGGMNYDGAVVYDILEEKLVKKIARRTNGHVTGLFLVADPDYIGLQLERKSVLKVGTWEIIDADDFYDRSMLFTSILDPKQQKLTALITPDRKFLISIEHQTISIANIDTKLFHYTWSSNGSLLYARVTPDGKYLQTIWKSGEIHVVDIAAAKVAYEYYFEIGESNLLQYSVTPGGAQILISTYKTKDIQIIDHQLTIREYLKSPQQ